MITQSSIKRTKIFCTIGPASAKPATLSAMIKAGMNVARLNMSHGTYAWHRQTMKMIAAAAKKAGEPVTLLADMQGPKIRLGVLPEAGVELKNGSQIVFTTASDAYRDGKLPVTYKSMHRDVKVGDRVMIDDGILEVRVTKISGKEIEAKVVNGGRVSSHKGMNFPDTTLKVRPITEKDMADVAFAVKAGVQWIAMSFVTRAADVKTMRGLIRKAMKKGQLEPKIIVKIEKHEALKAFDAILSAADGIMVARGDLGVETPAEDVPLRQKEMIAKCRAAGKLVVVATQMLDSMIRNPRPTRAEVSDVANAVIDHTEAVMLSGETASGAYPVEAVAMMSKICIDTETSTFDDLTSTSIDGHKKSSNELVFKELADLASREAIDAIVTATALGSNAASLNRFRPEVPLFLACATEAEARQWNVRWGIVPFVLGKKGDAIHQLKQVKQIKGKQHVAIVYRKHNNAPGIEVVVA